MRIDVKCEWTSLSTLPAHSDAGMLSITISDDQIKAFLEALAKAVASPAKKREAPAKAVGSTLHFDAFWSLYPAERRLAKSTVLAKWKALNLDKDWDDIRTYIHAELPKWSKDNFKYCPLVTTFVNQKRWTGFEPQQALAQIV